MLFPKPCLLSVIPLLLATTSYIVQGIALTIMYVLDPLDKCTDSKIYNKQEINNHNTQGNNVPALEHIRKVSMSVYDDYSHFMTTMILLHAIIRVLTSGSEMHYYKIKTNILIN